MGRVKIEGDRRKKNEDHVEEPCGAWGGSLSTKGV